MTNKILAPVLSLLDLIKIRISLSVSLTTFTGFILYSENLTAGVIVPVIAVFFMAGGASALNHYQERKFDSMMDRTKGRPLPSGNITPQSAIYLAVSCIFLGSVIFLIFSKYLALLLGLFAVIWYNGVYTYLKRVTPFAVIPGSLIGAIPPIIGWVAASGSTLDPIILAVAFFFFIGQIPHFWLLLLRYGKEYEEAGFRSITELFDMGQLRRLTFTWISATAVSTLIFPFFGIITDLFMLSLLLACSGLLITSFLGLIMIKDRMLRINQAFLKLNLYYLVIMLILILDALLM
jgi:protoheme IX farnesyltransferase